MSLTLGEVKSIINDITYKKGWEFNVNEREDCFVLKITFMAPDLHSDKIELQHCRKWFISKHACLAEIVRTAHKAVLAAEEHEADETFRYCGVLIHSPHTDPRDLVVLKKRGLISKNRREKQERKILK